MCRLPCNGMAVSVACRATETGSHLSLHWGVTTRVRVPRCSHTYPHVTLNVTSYLPRCMSSPTQTAAAEQPLTSLATALVEELSDHPHVAEATLGDSRRPPVVYVLLDGQGVTRGVEDIIADHNARIIDASVEPDENEPPRLRLTLRPDPPLKVAGSKKVRKSGNSLAVTLPREALELSGFEYEDDLAIEAREGCVRLTRRD